MRSADPFDEPYVTALRELVDRHDAGERELLEHEILVLLFDGPMTTRLLRSKAPEGAERLLPGLKRRGLVRSAKTDRGDQLWDLALGMHQRIARGEFPAAAPQITKKEATVAKTSWTLLTQRDLVDFLEDRDMSHVELAELLGVTKESVRNWAKKGRPPARARQEALVELMRKHSKAPKPPQEAQPKRDVKPEKKPKAVVASWPEPTDAEPTATPEVRVTVTHHDDEEPLVQIVARRAARALSRGAGWLRRALEAVEERGQQGRAG